MHRYVGTNYICKRVTYHIIFCTTNWFISFLAVIHWCNRRSSLHALFWLGKLLWFTAEYRVWKAFLRRVSPCVQCCKEHSYISEKWRLFECCQVQLKSSCSLPCSRNTILLTSQEKVTKIGNVGNSKQTEVILWTSLDMLATFLVGTTVVRSLYVARTGLGSSATITAWILQRLWDVHENDLTMSLWVFLVYIIGKWISSRTFHTKRNSKLPSKILFFFLVKFSKCAYII